MAGVLGLTTPVFLAMSGSLLSHNASLAWTGLFLWRYLRLLRDGRVFDGVVAGLSLGLVFLTRPFAALGVGLPLVAYLLGMALAGRHARLRRPLVGLLLSAGLVAALLPAYWWAVTGEARLNAHVLVWPYDRPGFGPDVGAQGYGLFELWNNLVFNLWALNTGAFGWPGWLNLIFIPLPFVLQKPRREEWLLLSIPLSLIAVHLAYWQYGGHDAGFPRYYYDGLISLLLLTARGVQLLGRRLAALAGSAPCAWRAPLAALPYALAAIFIASNLIFFTPPALRSYRTKNGISAAPIRAVEAAGLTNALVFIANYRTWSDFAAPFAANSPTLDGPVVFAIAEDEQQDARVISQFPGRTCWVWSAEQLVRCRPRSGGAG